MIDRHIQFVNALTNPLQKQALFRESKSLCTVCHKPLEVYYAEDGVYAVRCMRCSIVTVLRANDPITAAAWVGVEKPSLQNPSMPKEGNANE